jgi:hypothetical protein
LSTGWLNWLHLAGTIAEVRQILEQATETGRAYDLCRKDSTCGGILCGHVYVLRSREGTAPKNRNVSEGRIQTAGANIE